MKISDYKLKAKHCYISFIFILCLKQFVSQIIKQKPLKQAYILKINFFLDIKFNLLFKCLQIKNQVLQLKLFLKSQQNQIQLIFLLFFHQERSKLKSQSKEGLYLQQLCHPKCQVIQNSKTKLTKLFLLIPLLVSLILVQCYSQDTQIYFRCGKKSHQV
ncbi:transmembrane protein, putative (macronuclear) [Tetrahymena thermophila SB210]|uniref:Transmembrane protein, putative n=1 Tax=Tetrahymena thermophila (strain SB210) TaxID=312017 RepID=W7XHG1_TETTS|nr:transmembrane protein, putative [Tetrahymena thermophila SB210]EWS72539.1 transmembrane protein, putative [Tetrahymena thermophila SB210]|eukprot:XP_012654919.1 transmembrane protein, putative [Tetrahymena thermophila SB210]